VNIARFLLSTLRRGVRRLDRGGRKDIRDFVQSQAGTDGGYHGPGGTDADLYYTMFGASCMVALGGVRQGLSLRPFLKDVNPDGLDLPHATSLALLHRMALMRKPRLNIADFATGDGGFSHIPGDREQGSDYGAYLALILCQATGQRFPQIPLWQAHPDQAPDEAPGDTALSTALSAQLMLAAHVGADDMVGFLRGALVLRVCPQGGFESRDGAGPDLLCTASALAALRASGGVRGDLRTPQARFVEDCWTDAGGFRECPDHGFPDVEYTFYGLLALGAL